MLKLIKAAAVIVVVIGVGAVAANRWWNRTERRAVNTLAGMSGKNQ